MACTSSTTARSREREARFKRSVVPRSAADARKPVPCRDDWLVVVVSCRRGCNFYLQEQCGRCEDPCHGREREEAEIAFALEVQDELEDLDAGFCDLVASQLVLRRAIFRVLLQVHTSSVIWRSLRLRSERSTSAMLSPCGR